MNVKIGRFKGDFIEQPFCLKDYIHQSQLCKTRLFLMTKKILNNSLVMKMAPMPLSFDISDDDCDTFPNSLFSTSAVDMDEVSMNNSK